MKASEKSAIICILAKDVETALKRNIPKINRLRKYFKDSWIVVVENDSKDNTKSLLFQWQRSEKNIFIDSFSMNGEFTQLKTETSIFSGASRKRIEKMAFIRNRYLTLIKRENLHSDFIIVIDIDLDDFDEKKIVKAIFNAPDNWSAIFANGRLYSKVLNKKISSKFYDTYAFLPEDSLTNHLTYYEEFQNRDVHLKKYTPCKSAFGGIGIYKYLSLINSKYSTEENKRCALQEVVCEHISVNLEAMKFGRNYICKNLKTYYQQIPILISLLPTSVFIKLSLLKAKIKGVSSPETQALQPAASSQQPAASSQQPAASSQQPAASSQQHYVAKINFVKRFAKKSEIRRCA